MPNFVNFVLMARVVPRELLPLPYVPEGSSGAVTLRNRRSQQRLCRSRAVTSSANAMVRALNSLNGEGDLPLWQRPSESQCVVLDRLVEAARGDSPPSQPIDRQAALSELLANKASSYQVDEGFTRVASYDPSLVS